MKSIKKAISNLTFFLGVTTSPNLRKLLKHNKKFWKRVTPDGGSSERVVVSEQACGADFWSLIVSITASIVASAYGAKVVFLIQNKSSKRRFLSVIQKSFINCDFIYLGDRYEQRKSEINGTAHDIYNSLVRPSDILNIRYKEIAIGEQIYDSVLKHKHATLWRIDERVLLQIESAINCIDAILEILDANAVHAGVFTHTTGVYHGVAIRALLSRAKPVFIGFGGFNGMYRYNRVLDDRGQLDIHIKIPTKYFESILDQHGVRLLAEADEYFRKRFGGDINDWDAMRAFSPDKKLYKTRPDFFLDFTKLDTGKKNVFVMLHAMNDDPHVQRQHMFKDYYEWFAYTLKLARANRNVNWIFKQHPMIKFYPDDANLHGLFDLIEDEQAIIYIDETVPFNSASIPNIADVIITCAGTAGLEFTAFGIPAIIAAENSYAGYGLCHEPGSVKEYIELLDKVETLPRVSDETKSRAKILFYLIYKKLIPGYLTGFFPYLNHDEIKTLTETDAIGMYLPSLTHNNLGRVEVLKRFVLESSPDENAVLFMNVN